MTASIDSLRGKIDLTLKHYEPDAVEEVVNQIWDTDKSYIADNTSDKPPYTIVIPPPNVTGRLHMGHALNNTIQDALIRYKRMDGFNALWIPGTDHAGIATQTVVKKQLDSQGIDYRELGRDKMVEKIWEWKEKYGGQILNQLRRMGCSCDWSRTRFTMDEDLSRGVRVAFKKLYDAGLIYRGKYIVNWCPVDRTALSDEEVDTKDGGEPGNLWYLKYPLKDGSGYITVATTRPETMLGDTAIAINPKDERFNKLIGHSVIVPLVEREIKIIADDFVDAEFGTGCVKVTPAHDPNDFQMGLRHNLEQISIMNEDATMNELVPEAFQGMDRYECRKAVVAAMEDAGLLEKIEERNVPVGRSYRSKAIIEYRLSDQWFVKMGPLAEEALKASQAGKLQFYPDRWDSFYRRWLENTRDWCISRQLWWGHRIPAWYNKETGEMLVDTETPDAVESNPELWEQDEDVLDTWFSSALWPYSTLGWPDKTTDLEKFYPTSVLVTGKDIIFFWVSRMVMTGLFNVGEMPFSDVVINSIICDEDGETMSKSKGNGIDPLHVISGATTKDLEGPIYEARPANMDKLLERLSARFPDGFPGVGADALRFTLLTPATDAQQSQISLKRFDEVGRRLTNKIWNAAKLVFATLDDVPDASVSPAEPSIEDTWILGQLDKMVAELRTAFDTYSFHHATDRLYHFFWDDICDWYLEIIKPRIWDGSDADKRRVALTLAECFSGFLRGLHPVMPFVSEALWGPLQERMAAKGLYDSAGQLQEAAVLAKAPFPTDRGRFSETISSEFELVQEIIRSIRNVRAEASIGSKEELEVKVLITDAAKCSGLEASVAMIARQAKLSSLDMVTDKPEGYSATVLSGLQLFINTAAFRDIAAELEKAKGSLEKIDASISQLEARLGNESFTSKAPEKVVQEVRDKLAAQQEKKGQLLAVVEELEAL